MVPGEHTGQLRAEGTGNEIKVAQADKDFRSFVVFVVISFTVIVATGTYSATMYKSAETICLATKQCNARTPATLRFKNGECLCVTEPFDRK